MNNGIFVHFIGKEIDHKVTGYPDRKRTNEHMNSRVLSPVVGDWNDWFEYKMGLNDSETLILYLEMLSNELIMDADVLQITDSLLFLEV